MTRKSTLNSGSQVKLHRKSISRRILRFSPVGENFIADSRSDNRASLAATYESIRQLRDVLSRRSSPIRGALSNSSASLGSPRRKSQLHKAFNHATPRDRVLSIARRRASFFHRRALSLARGGDVDRCASDVIKNIVR